MLVGSVGVLMRFEWQSLGACEEGCVFGGVGG